MFARSRLTLSAASNFVSSSSFRPAHRRTLLFDCIKFQTSSERSLHTPRHNARGNQERLYIPNSRNVLQASSATSLVIAATVAGSIAIAAFFLTSTGATAPEKSIDEKPPEPTTTSTDWKMHPDASPGHVGNLTEEQEAKLREFWSATLKVFGVDLHATNGDAGDALKESAVRDFSQDTTLDETASIAASSPDKKKGKRRLGIFGKKGGKEKDDDASDTASTFNTNAADGDDKYGHQKEFQKTLAEMKPEELRTSFWSMVKTDHPDSLLLRFLRARKWDVEKALVMMIATMRWRIKGMRVDDDIIAQGEGGALVDTQDDDKAVRKEAEDFLRQMKLGKSLVHGMDKEGRPICNIRVRLHKASDQSVGVVERYTVFTIETCRLMLVPPVETACLIFDMTGFSLANMDYTPVKFMIKCFEANYPESLGNVLIHRAPWVFQGIWKIIRGWLDPVVAGKVHFTNTLEDLEEYVPRENVIKELGGPEEWSYAFKEPTLPDDKPVSQLTGEEKTKRDQLLAERAAIVLQFQKKTHDWIAAGGSKEIMNERNRLAASLREGYWDLDPFLRARTLQDRIGVIMPGGKINFYPERGNQHILDVKADPRTSGNLLEVPNMNGGTATRASSFESFRTAPMHREDDVD